LTRRLRYPPHSMLADFARAAAGLMCTLVPIVWMQPAGIVVVALAAGAAIFLVYFARTFLICLSSIELDGTGIRATGPAFGAAGAAIPWEELRLVRLKYFTTRNDREHGWMQLELRGRGRRIAVDSRIEGFRELAATVAAAAQRRSLELDHATRANLEALQAARQ
jgi:hypothetical protein